MPNEDENKIDEAGKTKDGEQSGDDPKEENEDKAKKIVGSWTSTMKQLQNDDKSWW